MSNDFEEQLADRLRRHSAITVRPYDADAIAAGAKGATETVRWPTLSASRFSRSGAYALLVVGFLLALVIAVAVAGRLPKVPTLPPLGRNGTIAYIISDPQLPFNQVHFLDPVSGADRSIAQGIPAHTVLFSVDGSAYASAAISPGVEAGEPTQEFRVTRSDGETFSVYGSDPLAPVALSPDGRHMIFVTDPSFATDGASHIVLVDVESGASRELLPPRSDIDGYGSISWSPNGDMLAFVVVRSRGDFGRPDQTEIDVVNIATGHVQLVTRRLTSETLTPAWAPDSTALAYAGLPDGGSVAVAWLSPFIVKVDGSSDTRISAMPVATDLGWAPDGSAIAFTTYDGADASKRLAIVGVGGAAPVGATKIGPAADQFDWSPDATRILFANNTNVWLPPQTPPDLHATMSLVDRDFNAAPARLLDGDYVVLSLSWQRLDP